MGIIILNILFLFWYAWKVEVSTLNTGTKRFIFLAIAFLHLMFMHTFFDVSPFPDLPGYFAYFKNLSNPNIDSPNLEIGWNILNRILYFISHNKFILLFAVSFLIILFYIITVNRYSAIPWLSIFLILCIVFYDSLFILRQHLAIPICLMSIPYVIERKPIKFILLTLLAVSFHYSALIWIPVYFIYPIKIDKRFVFMLIIFSVLFYFSLDIILKNLISLTRRIMQYTNPNNQGALGSLKGSAVVLSTLLLSLYSFKKVDILTGYNKLFFQLSMIAFVLNFIPFFGTSFTFFFRLHLYYTVSSIFLIPNAIDNINDKRLYFILIPVICICYLFYLRPIAQYGYGF
jgi:hypothetical protein